MPYLGRHPSLTLNIQPKKFHVSPVLDIPVTSATLTGSSTSENLKHVPNMGRLKPSVNHSHMDHVELIYQQTYLFAMQRIVEAQKFANQQWIQWQSYRQQFFDLPRWLKALRLHKYASCFTDVSELSQLVHMDDNELLQRGVVALGARRRFLRAFDSIKSQYRL
jgi:hypothetical protein